MIITETFDNATEIVPVTASMASGFNNSTVGNQTITVNAGSFTDSFTVSVISNTVVNNQNIEADISNLNLLANVGSVSLKSEILPTQGEGLPAIQALKASENISNEAGAVIYSLELVDSNGQKIAFSGTVTVRIPIPAGMSGNLHVFWFNPTDGSLHDMKATQENGYLVFQTTHFSNYAIAQFTVSPNGGNPTGGTSPGESKGKSTTAATESNPTTGSDDWPIIPMAILGGSAAAGALIVKRRRYFRKKKQAE